MFHSIVAILEPVVELDNYIALCTLESALPLKADEIN